ncbi:MAG: fused MFS/spermidine synthase, partial [Myxococcota bacterium]
VVLAGLVLPALWRLAPREIGDLGGHVGRLAAINTLAGVLGSVGAGFVLLPWLGIVRGFAVVALVFCAVGCIGWLCSSRGVSRTVALAGMGVGAGLLLWADGWQVTPFTVRSGESLVHYEEGEAGSVAVARLPSGRLRLRVNDRYTLTSTARASRRAQRSMTRLPLALVEEPRSVAFIGVGGAISMSALTEFPSVDRVLGMELIPGVLRAAPHFKSANRSILDDPRVEVLVADGRNHLHGRSERFDAVVGEVFSPWHAGTGYLYTAEHFEAVAQRLSDDGVFVQWLQSDQFSPEEARIVAATFLDAFPGAELWMTRRSGPVPLLGLVGWAPGARSRVPEPAWATKMSFPVRLCDAQQLAAWAASAERNTDDRAIVEYRASWAHQWHRAGPKRARRVLRVVAAACGFEPNPTGEDREGRSDGEDGEDNGV